MAEIEINGKKIQAEQGAMLIEAADENNVRIPRFCYHKKLSVAANCRMCLVEVEGAPKPLPACATPISDGMKVFTHSPIALEAQRAVMEFLLINHPLDCPVCDQGGECELQDVSMGYGSGVSRFNLGKRSVEDKNIGPLIATEMTRCIHCTRCVRFGKEVAGMHELGMVGRGEHSEISTYIERSVDSELSGNMIDLCPVGALTAKPYRFSARAWELAQHASVAAHDCVGSHVYAHTLHNQVKRVVPKDVEAVNETWIADRDRFSYEGLYHEDRITQPKIKEKGQWRDVDWQTALQFAAEKLLAVKKAAGGEAFAGLASASQTNEALFLMQKLLRGLGSQHIDHRLRQVDFADQQDFPAYPHMGVSIEAVAKADHVLLVGSHLRKEQPIIANRVRLAMQKGALLSVVNPMDFKFTVPVDHKHIVAGGDLLKGLATLAKAFAEETQQSLPQAYQALAGELDEAIKAQAKALAQVKQGVIFLGALAHSHPQASALRGLATWLAAHSANQVGLLTEGANSAGAWLMGCVPHRAPAGAAVNDAGQDVQALFANESIKAFLLLGVEPEYDTADSGQALAALQKAECVVAMHAYQTPALLDYADVILPSALFAETAGTYVNGEGRWQAFNATTNPQGESRPAWKILRVLGNVLQQDGFEYMSLADVQTEIDALAINREPAPLAFTLNHTPQALPAQLVRIAETPIYAVDAVVRRAQALQATQDAQFQGVHINAAQAEKLGLSADSEVNVTQNAHSVYLPLVIDARVPDNAAYLPASVTQTLGLGAAYQAITIEAVGGA